MQLCNEALTLVLAHRRSTIDVDCLLSFLPLCGLLGSSPGKSIVDKVGGASVSGFRTSMPPSC